MKSTILIVLSLLIPIIHSEPDPNFHIYLAFGQSNMEGNGPIEQQDLDNIPSNYKMLACVDFPTMDRQKGNWYPAIPPLCHEYSHLSVLDYFGRTMAEKVPSDITIGVLNVAVGGCSIKLFDEDIREEFLKTADWLTDAVKKYDDDPYKVLVEMGKKAQEDGVIKGILFHQGESDSGDTNWPNSVKKIYERLLEDLGLSQDEVPLLVGEMLDQASGGVAWDHNKILDTLPDLISNCHVIESEGLPGQDAYHFSSEGYRGFGKRYAEKMLEILGL